MSPRGRRRVKSASAVIDFLKVKIIDDKSYKRAGHPSESRICTLIHVETQVKAEMRASLEHDIETLRDMKSAAELMRDRGGEDMEPIIEALEEAEKTRTDAYTSLVKADAYFVDSGESWKGATRKKVETFCVFQAI